MRQGTQIIYLPDHAETPAHPDAELGFVTEDKGNICFCRFWKGFTLEELRTTANSKAVHKRNLDHAPAAFRRSDKLIEQKLKELGYNE